MNPRCEVLVVGAEPEGVHADEAADAEHVLAVEARGAEETAQAALARPLARDEPAVGEDVVDRQRPLVEGDVANVAALYGVPERTLARWYYDFIERQQQQPAPAAKPITSRNTRSTTR